MSTSVDECRRLFYFFVGDLSCLSAVVSVSWLSVNICCRRVVMSASCLSASCHRFVFCVYNIFYHNFICFLLKCSHKIVDFLQCTNCPDIIISLFFRMYSPRRDGFSMIGLIYLGRLKQHRKACPSTKQPCCTTFQSPPYVTEPEV